MSTNFVVTCLNCVYSFSNDTNLHSLQCCQSDNFDAQLGDFLGLSEVTTWYSFQWDFGVWTTFDAHYCNFGKLFLATLTPWHFIQVQQKWSMDCCLCVSNIRMLQSNFKCVMRNLYKSVMFNIKSSHAKFLLRNIVTSET